MLQRSCYKHITDRKSHASAQLFCENEGSIHNTTGNLAAPFSLYHVSLSMNVF